LGASGTSRSLPVLFMWGVGPKETMAAELREDPIQRGGWVMGLFLKVNRLDFSSLRNARQGSLLFHRWMPSARRKLHRPRRDRAKRLVISTSMQNFPHFPGRDRRCRALRRSTACLPGSIPIRATLAAGDLRGGIHPDPDRALVRDDR
jgi:hypothetical protein